MLGRCTITITVYDGDDATQAFSVNFGYKLSKLQEKINHLMYMDDIKLLAKNEKKKKNRSPNTDIENIQWIYKNRIWHRKFDRNEKWETRGTEWNYQIKKKSEHSEKRKPTNTRKYWKRTLSHKWRWKKIKKEYLRRTKKLFETKLNIRNLIKGINTGAVLLIRYSGPFLKWTWEDLKQMNQTRKLMT